MHASTASAELWQCLRCGAYVPGAPHGTGPAAQAPAIRRGKQIRGDLLLKLFAIERGIRVLIFGAVAFGIWKVANSPLTFAQAFRKESRIVQSLFSQLGFTISHSLIDRVNSLLHISKTNLHLIALGIAGLALVSAIESVALWQAKRWGEYFATIVTSLGLPFEVYELAKAVTATKVVLFILNLLLVGYLIHSRRLFGARGGKEAYENRLRHDSVLDEAVKAAAAMAAVVAPASASVSAAGPDAGPAVGPAAPAVPAGPGVAAVTVPMGKTRPMKDGADTSR
ncbi:MAG TPA: DUF2127 domain-containing protein [Streptosporangiaceae bacterium]